MAQTVSNLLPVIYDAFIDDYASEYAYAMAGSPLFEPVDRQAWQEHFDRFKAAVDTPEKLMRVVAALPGAEE
jgi:hypothetical protein